MYIDDFIWLPDILEKLAVKHQVTQDEAEEVFFNHPRYRFVESGYRQGEDVYSTIGQTDAGRYLIVFFIHKPDNTVLILSARDMDKKERRHYEQK
ncbi:MAG: BrnT family toxin [Candidatus Desantisbacteria bacterium]